jgi:hypothetical protein
MATSKGCKGRNTKINYGMDTRGEKKKRTSKKTWMKGVQADMTTRKTGRNGFWFPDDGDGCYKTGRTDGWTDGWIDG